MAQVENLVDVVLDALYSYVRCGLVNEKKRKSKSSLTTLTPAAILSLLQVFTMPIPH